MKLFPYRSQQLPVLIGLIAILITLSACKEHNAEQTHQGHEHTLATTATHTHAKPGETCFICDPDKRDKGRLWCNEHARYEDRCWLCHPELEDKNRPYCNKHFLYEDECFLCNPNLKPSTPNSRDTTATSAASPALFCNEHSVPEMECGICQPQLAATLTPGKSLLVRFPSTASAEKSGIHTDTPKTAEILPGLNVICETQYNKSTLAKITPLTGGVVSRVYADMGDQVQTEDILVEIHSAEVATAKSTYLSALVNMKVKDETQKREKKLVEEHIAAQKDFIEAEAAYRMARLEVHNTRQKLLNMGLSEDTLAEIEHTENTSALLKIRAPFSGTLIDRTAVIGQAVAPGEPVFTLADLTTHWLILSIPADKISQLHINQSVEAQFNELPGETFIGKITYIDSAIDERTRLMHARALITHGANRLKAGLFGRAQVIASQKRLGLLIPRHAIQHHEQKPFVFVKQAADLFALRRVVLGNTQENGVEITSGLHTDDQVVTTASFMVMSEFLKSKLGAGCVDE